MSGLAGAFDPSGHPIDRDMFARVVSYVAYRGPDGVRTWQTTSGIAMAFAQFIRTPDAVADRQPRCEQATELCVTFDGRLDNRAELTSQLGAAVHERTPDSALAAAAYRRWGTESAAKLLGDFSFIVWDGRERRLFAARDVAAARPLFYRVLNGVWWWASDQRALLELGMPAINLGYVGEHLSCRVTSIDETIYEGIQRLPMAHALTIGRGAVRRWRYWRPDPDHCAGYRDQRDYEAQFRTLLKEAVRARLRLHGRAAHFLSGGIDSSSVAAQIAELRHEGHDGASEVTAISMTIPGSIACEGPVIRQVIDRLQLPAEIIAAREPVERQFAADAETSLDIPELPNTSMTQPLRDAASTGGRSVVLTGYGGDDWFETSFAELSDLLRRGRVAASARWLGAVAGVPNNVAIRQIVSHGIWMALPEGAKRIVRCALRRTGVPPWIDPRFARIHNLADRFRQTPDDVEFESRARYDIFRSATSGEATFRADHEERYTAARGLEYRHPLMDRRLIEFALALPPELRCTGGVSKTLMRRAMSHALPADVTVTPRNDDFGFLGLRVLSRLGGEGRLLETYPVRQGWVRADSVRGMYRMLEGGVTRNLWPLCAATGIDFWLRALENAVRNAVPEATWTKSPRPSGMTISDDIRENAGVHTGRRS